MKQNNILKGFKSFFLSFGKFLLLAFLCAFTGFIILWPLWAFAVYKPDLYTKVFSFVLVFLILAFITYKIVKKFKGNSPEEKKANLANLLRGLLLAFIAVAGIIGSVILVLNHLRLAALIVFVVMAVIFGVCYFGIKKR